jgi:hypothetical protein
VVDRDLNRAARTPEGAQAEWLGMLESLAEQIQKQQRNSQQMIQEMMDTYMQLLNTLVPTSPLRPSSSNKPFSRRPSSGWSKPGNSSSHSSSRLNNNSKPSSR